MCMDVRGDLCKWVCVCMSVSPCVCVFVCLLVGLFVFCLFRMSVVCICMAGRNYCITDVVDCFVMSECTFTRGLFF